MEIPRVLRADSEAWLEGMMGLVRLQRELGAKDICVHPCPCLCAPQAVSLAMFSAQSRALGSVC